MQALDEWVHDVVQKALKKEVLDVERGAEDGKKGEAEVLQGW